MVSPNPGYHLFLVVPLGFFFNINIGHRVCVRVYFKARVTVIFTASINVRFRVGGPTYCNCPLRCCIYFDWK